MAADFEGGITEKNRPKELGNLDMDGWYYKIFGIEFGPVKLDKLIELAKSHAISRDDQVRFGEKGSWRRVGTIGQLMAHLPFEASQKVIGGKSTEPEADTSNSPVFDQVPAAPMSDHPTPTDTIETVDTDRRWWCNIQGREYGPVELPKLIEWAATGRLLRDDLVRFGNDPYVLASELPGLFPDQASVMPPPNIQNIQSNPVAPTPPIQKAS